LQKSARNEKKSCKRIHQTVNIVNGDGFVKSPTSALCCILRFFKVRKVRIITQDLRALNLNFYTLPSKSDFLLDYQTLMEEKWQQHWEEKRKATGGGERRFIL